MSKMRQWMDTLGSHAKVVVLDSGLATASGVRPAEVKNFTHQPINLHDRHGTDMAEIIAGRDPMEMGYAPYCDLYVGKVWTGQPADWHRYEEALQWAIDVGAEVVNMSFGVSNVSDGFLEKIHSLDRAGCICVVAHSSLGSLHDCPAVISAGRLGLNQTAKALVVGETYKRSLEGKWRRVAGTSVAAATLSGVAACAKALTPDINRERFLSELQD